MEIKEFNKNLAGIDLGLNYDLIQEIRLAHALMESKYKVCIPEKDSLKFAKLNEIFRIKYVLGNNCVPLRKEIEVNHRKPFTRIGDITKPLIFPKGIFFHCKNLWQDKRDHKFLFVGLLNKERWNFLRKWMKTYFPEEVKKLGKIREIVELVFKKIHRFFPFIHFKDFKIKTEEFYLYSTQRGREFPIKSWDEEYYRLLSRSQFVLCPKGDMPWTYRFFEAIMCGAIPLIDEECKEYEGFFFYNLGDPLENIKWDKDKAESNFERCLNYLTIPTEDLNKELDKIINKYRPSKNQSF